MLVNGCGCSLAGPSPAAPGTVPTRHCHTQHSAPASSTPGTLTLITQRTHTHSLGALILIIRHPHTQHSVHSSSAPGTLILNTRSPQPPLLSLASCLPCRLSCPPLVNQVSHLPLWSPWPRNHRQPRPQPHQARQALPLRHSFPELASVACRSGPCARSLLWPQHLLQPRPPPLHPLAAPPAPAPLLLPPPFLAPALHHPPLPWRSSAAACCVGGPERPPGLAAVAGPGCLPPG